MSNGPKGLEQYDMAALVGERGRRGPRTGGGGPLSWGKLARNPEQQKASAFSRKALTRT